MSRQPQYWLVKTEPDCFSIQDLAKSPKRSTCWSGVRNYQARNFMRDGMKLGDRVLIYHSSVNPPAVVGIARVCREAYPDHTAWDPRDDHFDPQSTKENPRWFMVDLQLERVFDQQIPLDRLRGIAELRKMELLRRGSRLSVQPVSAPEFAAIERLANASADSD